MKINKLKIAISIFSMLLCFGVFAQGPPGGQGGRGGERGQGQQRGGQPDATKILSKLDTNNDNKISRSEAGNDRRGKISDDFDQIDTNSDEFIDLEELKASLDGGKSERKPKKKSANKIIKDIDDNGDGTLNELEIAAKGNDHLSKNFKEIDTNNDGELDLEELKVFNSKSDKKNRKKRRQN